MSKKVKYFAKVWVVVWPSTATKEYKNEPYKDHPRGYMPIDAETKAKFQYKSHGKKFYGVAIASFSRKKEAQAWMRAEGYAGCFIIRPAELNVL